MAKQKHRKKTVVRTALALAALPFVLLFAAIMALYLPPVQNWAVKKATTYASEATGYQITIGSLYLQFPLRLAVEHVAVIDLPDTLLSVERLHCNVHLLPLLKQNVEIDYIELTDAWVNTKNLIEGMSLNGYVGHLRLTVRQLEPAKSRIAVRQFLLNNTNINLSLEQTADTIEKEEEGTIPSLWQIEVARVKLSNIGCTLQMADDSLQMSARLGQLDVKNISVDLQNTAYRMAQLMIKESSVSYDKGSNEAKEGLDTDHLSVTDLRLSVDSLLYSPQIAKAKLSLFSFRERSRLAVIQCRGVLAADSLRIKLSDLLLQTDNQSSLGASAELPWSAIESAGTRGTGSARLTGILSKQDVELLGDSSLKTTLQLYPDTLLRVTVEADGNLNEIRLKECKAVVPSMAILNIKGEVNRATDTLLRNARITLKAEATRINRIRGIKDSLQNNDTARLILNGTAQMEGSRCNADLNIRLPEGEAEGKAEYHLNERRYRLNFVTRSLSLQSLLPDIPLSCLNMQLNAEGEGFELSDSCTRVSVHTDIEKISFDSIELNDLSIGAALERSRSNLIIKSDNPAFPLNIEGDAHIQPHSIEAAINIELSPCDLQPMLRMEQPLKAGFNLNAKAKTNLAQDISLQADLRKMQIVTVKKSYRPADIRLTANTAPDTFQVRLNSGDFHLQALGEDGINKLSIHFSQFATALMQEIERSDSSIDIQGLTASLPNLSLRADCGKNNPVYNFANYMGYTFDSLHVDAKTTPIAGIRSESFLYGLRNDSLQLDTLRFFIRQDSSQIGYFGGVRSTSPFPGQQRETFGAFINGTLRNSGGNLKFTFVDGKREVGVRLEVEAALVQDGIRLHFQPQSTLFFEPFSFNENNYFTYRKELPIEADIHLVNEKGLGLRFYSLQDSTMKEDLNLELTNIDLKKISDAVPFIPKLSGLLSMDMHYVKQEFTTLACDLGIRQFSYNNQLLGDELLEIVYLPQSEQSHYINCNFIHNDREVLMLEGSYSGEENGLLDANMEIKRFPLQLSNAFLPDIPVLFGGYLQGAVSVNGDLASPAINGDIRFDSVSMDIPTFSAKLRFDDNEKVTINENKLQFDKFKIYAKGKTPFTVDGYVNFKNLSNPYMNINMNAIDYELLNAKRNKVSYVYGKVFMDYRSNISGYLNSLNIGGKITVLGNTNVTYILKDTPLSVNNDLENLITFTNFNATEEDTAKEKEQATYDLGSMSVNMTIEIENGAQINADLDENRGSYIELEGGGNLNMNYTSEEGLTLTGRYTLSNGELKYTMPLLPLKTFNIGSGSYIHWTGDLMNPTLNISASERVITSAAINDVMQTVAFDAGVKITNTLDNMGLSFFLEAPGNATVQSELAAMSPEEQNKYAVAMLITGVYLGSGGKLSATGALTSYLQNQIDNIAKSTLKSDINFNMGISSGEDTETGDSYTDYSFSFAKRFWNDRISIIIGGTISDNNQNKNQNETFIDNVTLEWRLDKSGNRYAKIFFDKNNESILEGEITETGIGYVVRKQLTNMGELFIFRKKRDPEHEPAERKEVKP